MQEVNFDEILEMKPMARYHFLKENYCTCSSCKEVKLLRDFFVKKEMKFTKYCKKCERKLYNEEIRQIVLKVLQEELK